MPPFDGTAALGGIGVQTSGNPAAAARVRGRSERRARAPWIYRCRLMGRNVAIDVDAFSVGEASGLAAAHWGVDAGEVAVDGQRRRLMRWIGVSTHVAVGRRVPMDRVWWYSAKLAAVIVVAAAAAILVNATIV